MKEFVCGNEAPVVQTTKGKVRGFQTGGIYKFYGIKYADAKRFQMPGPVKSWDGIYDATNYGFACPILHHPKPENEIKTPHLYWPEDEDCQYLNVLTGNLDKNARKPVMVWVHPGGFADGWAVEQTAQDGEALVKYGDVVMVSFNHRLNILGFLDMSSFGEKYWNSGNAGMADVVEVLKWVRDNISAFGGDPDNVTVFGQSGGGDKICTLLQAPAAAGLFHKAIVMSGVTRPGRKTVDDRELVLALLDELELSEAEVEKLEIVPYPVLAKAFERADRRFVNEGQFVMWMPHKNDWFLGHALEVGFTDYAKRVPFMAGNCFSELTFSGILDKHSLSQREVREKLTEKYGDHTDELIGLFQRTYPQKDLIELLNVDTYSRIPTMNYCDEKMRVSTAPTYSYMFALEFDLYDGVPAWHCADIPFAFHNTSLVPVCSIEGVTEKLEQEVFNAWVSFARTGDPNHPGLARWPEYEEKKHSVMVFDRESGARDDFDRELINAVARAAAPSVSLNVILAQAIASRLDDDVRWRY